MGRVSSGQGRMRIRPQGGESVTGMVRLEETAEKQGFSLPPGLPGAMTGHAGW